MNSPLIVGFLASFTLIAAIGAQNAFVLRQGIRREHVLPVVALCTVSDIAPISAGIAGVGALINAHPAAVNVANFGGALFLFPGQNVEFRYAVELVGGRFGRCVAFALLGHHMDKNGRVIDVAHILQNRNQMIQIMFKQLHINGCVHNNVE